MDPTVRELVRRRASNACEYCDVRAIRTRRANDCRDRKAARRLDQSHERLGTEGRADGDRVVRGGAFNNNARNARCAYRINNHPDNRNNNIGFRVVVVPRLISPPEMRFGSLAEAPRRRLKAGPVRALAAPILPLEWPGKYKKGSCLAVPRPGASRLLFRR